MKILNCFKIPYSCSNLKFFTTRLLLAGASFLNAYGFEYNCRSFYNPLDVSQVIQHAINSGASKIIIPYMGKDSKWISGPLTITNQKDIEIVLEPGVILESKSGFFPDKSTSFITINECSNIKIKGFDAEIRMLKHEYCDTGEWRHGISILASDDIEIQGLKISGSGGDGIYLGSSKTTGKCCSNIVIQDVIADQNARNGISVISCKNLLIENCEIKNTGRNNHPNNASNGPWAGIDLEANFEHESLENIEINNCTLDNNKGAGVSFAFGCRSNTISMTNNKIYDNWSGINLLGKLRGNTGQVLIKNNIISGKHYYGLYVLNWNKTAIPVNFEDCTFDIQEITFPVKFEITHKSNTFLTYGNVSFKNTRFINLKHLCLIYLEGADSTNYFDNISLAGTTKSYEDEFHEFQNDNVNRNSLYTLNSIEGDNIFCCVEKGLMSITISPNPFNDRFLFKCNTLNPIDMRIYDVYGRSLVREYIRNGDYIDCGHLSDGQYIIIAKDIVGQRVAVEKLIKL